MKTNKDFRILVETMLNGIETFYVKERFLFVFWRKVKQYDEFSGYPMSFKTLQEAENYILKEIDHSKAVYMSKVVKKRTITLSK